MTRVKLISDYAALNADIRRRGIIAALLIGAAAGALATVALINLL